MELEGKVGIVTGAAGGIGRAAALLLGERGATVVCADRNADGVTATARAIEDAGGQARAAEVDVGDDASVDRLVAEASDAGGRLDFLFANAAIHDFGTILDCEPPAWDEMFRVNLRGVYLCARRALPDLARTGGGSIVATSSDCAVRTCAQSAAYVATKAGVVALMRSIAVDFGSAGIRANVVTPGVTDTPGLRAAYSLAHRTPEVGIAQAAALSPLARIGEPREIAEAVAFLISDRASFVTGANLIVDGGMTVTYGAD